MYRLVMLFQVPHLEMTADREKFNSDTKKFAKLLKSFNERERMCVPIFASMTNVSRMRKNLVKGSTDSNAPSSSRTPKAKDSICCILRKNGFVEKETLKAMVVYDEADLNINVDVKGNKENTHANKITKEIFTNKVTVGEPGDDFGSVLTADNFFDLFTASLDVTATPHSLVYSKRDQKPESLSPSGTTESDKELPRRKRPIKKIITGTPSKFGFQYECRPDWKSKTIGRMEMPENSDISVMIDDMIWNEQPLDRHAAVIGARTRQKVDQKDQARRYAARYRDSNLITSTWSGDGVSVFTACAVKRKGGTMSIDFICSGSELSLIDNAFELLLKTEDNGKATQMYLSPVGDGVERQWDSADIESRVRRKKRNERIKKLKTKIMKKKEFTRKKNTDDGTAIKTSDGKHILEYEWSDGWITEEALEEKVRALLKQREDAFEERIKKELSIAEQKEETTWIAEYTADKRGYPEFIDRLHKAMFPKRRNPRERAYPGLRINTVVFGKNIMDRGVTVKGAETHKCDLTDMYVSVSAHYTQLIQVCGRLCGNHYHECDKCPTGTNEVCMCFRNNCARQPRLYKEWRQIPGPTQIILLTSALLLLYE